MPARGNGAKACLIVTCPGSRACPTAPHALWPPCCRAPCDRRGRILRPSDRCRDRRHRRPGQRSAGCRRRLFYGAASGHLGAARPAPRRRHLAGGDPADRARRLSDYALKVIIAILLVGVGLKEVYDAVGGAAPHLITTTIRMLAPRDYGLIAAGGILVGVASGVTGVGGGILIVPFLALGFGIGQRVAQGTSLVAVLPTAAIGALTHYRGGNVDLRAAMWMGGAGAPAALIGAVLALYLPQRALGGIFGVFLLLAATRTWPLGSPPRGEVPPRR